MQKFSFINYLNFFNFSEFLDQPQESMSEDSSANENCDNPPILDYYEKMVRDKEGFLEAYQAHVGYSLLCYIKCPISWG